MGRQEGSRGVRAGQTLLQKVSLELQGEQVSCVFLLQLTRVRWEELHRQAKQCTLRSLYLSNDGFHRFKPDPAGLHVLKLQAEVVTLYEIQALPHPRQ